MKILKYLKTTIHKVKINTSDSFFMKLEFLKQSFETSKIVKETDMDKVNINYYRPICLKYQVLIL